MLPDIGVFGPYTYLVTEAVFGTLALGLLRYTGALDRAGRTVLALYPLAYVWDWYTLHVGVFEIPLRTGIELLGIPIEEHLFIVVVPSLVVAVHELVNGAPERADTTARTSVGDEQSGETDRVN